ncbi:HPP family protein [Sphingomonas montanisoli]|uniref:HPP family protein n=1 Tax=Sphingomonas montanisoli TaxID=2606412 RepID=A0A5D9C806_9SPHN|nr:HPP family protein [Sphingomonas montanisoli]TZG27904.1 HPP family protein [Sphingomonas montanisoli]
MTSWFRPLIAGATLGDRAVASVGALLGITLTMLVCAYYPFAMADLPLIVAPIGASAVLAFAVPASPLAQPWSVVGGNIVSTLIGIAAFRLVPEAHVAAGVAVGGAILAMSLLRCLHPPGGAAALTAVIGGPAIHAAGWSFAFVPVGINSIALAALAIAFHRWSGHSYPHRALPPVPEPLGLNLADIDQALADMPDSFDIARADLDALLTRAEHHAIQRRTR